MSPLGWIVFLGFGVLIAAAARGLVAFWRGESRVWEHRPAWWPWGELVFRAWVRMMALGVATLALLDIIFLFSELGAYEGDGAEFWLAAIPLFLLLTVWILCTTVAFYNRPRWVVPPHLRDDPGIVQGHVSRRRKR
jgi:hypothetical protein